MPIIKNKKK